jgi:hypothetical protein
MRIITPHTNLHKLLHIPEMYAIFISRFQLLAGWQDACVSYAALRRGCPHPFWDHDHFIPAYPSRAGRPYFQDCIQS